MNKPTTLPYRPCVGLMLINREGQVFIGHRADSKPSARRDFSWQMPQGGIDEGEDPYSAGLRELYEETNVRSVSLLAEAPDWFFYDLPPDLVGSKWQGRYRGQKLRWFALRFTGSDDEIDVLHPGGGHHKAEFDEWRWEDIDRIAELVVPFKRPVYDRVVEAFRPLVRPQGK